MSLTIKPSNSDDDGAPLVAEFQALRDKAEAGDPESQRDLGCAYVWGDDAIWGRGLVPHDLTLARHWYTLAAEQFHPQAMWDVNSMLLRGEGGPPDVERALRYLRILATRRRHVLYGEDAAQLLASFHQDGDFGLSQNPAEVEKWLRLAKDHRRFYRGYLRKHVRPGRVYLVGGNWRRRQRLNWT
jgi:hypothetical protein